MGANGTGFVFAAVDGVFNSPSEAGYADIPLATILQLSNGNHTIYVHAKDAAGNWGATSSTILLDRQDRADHRQHQPGLTPTRPARQVSSSSSPSLKA